MRVVILDDDDVASRLRAALADNDAVFTVGGHSDGPQGFRAYRDGRAGGEQLTVVWGEDGALQVLVVGDALGCVRTGALGAVSVDALARADAHRLAVIGTGGQAWAQVRAATAVRRWRDVRVYSRDLAARTAFARRVEVELGLPARVGRNAEATVAGADVVVLATSSPEPVVDAAAIAAGARVITIGPKSMARHKPRPP